MPPSYFVALVVVVLVAVVWKLVTRGRGDASFILTVKGPGTAGISIQGEVPGVGAAELSEFVAQLELPTGARIWGIRDGDRLALRFSDVPEGPQQRVRNLVLNRFR